MVTVVSTQTPYDSVLAQKPNESVLLFNAVRSNEHHVINATLDRGADIEFYSMEERIDVRTPLRAACHSANTKVIRTLLSRGASVFQHFNRDRWTALHSAAHGGNDHIIRLLMVEAPELHENTDHDGFSLAHLVGEILNAKLTNGGADLVVWATKYMPTMNINARSHRLGYADWTLLHLACARGRLKAVACLLRVGAQPDATTGEFHLRSAKLNEYALAGIESDDSKPLHEKKGAQIASIETDFEKVQPQWLDKGLLPIHLAAFGGHFKTLSLLVRHGASVNATTMRHRWTPLMFAVWSGKVELVREILRIGGRKVVNFADRRPDGSEWTPLAVAVARWHPEMVQTLIAYGADPLARLGQADFPGRAFIRHVSPAMLDAPGNHWSGQDRRISLLHIAVVRGDLAMLRTLLPLLRAAHHTPVKSAAAHPGFIDIIPWQDASCRTIHHDRHRNSVLPSTAKSMRGRSDHGVTMNLSRSLQFSKGCQERARQRLLEAPQTEAQDCDPVSFCTAEGWSPAILAALLHSADPMRQVRLEFVESFPDPTQDHNTRATVFTELLGTGRSLLEDRPDASPPVMPQRFHDVSETLVCRSVDEFVSLCKAAGSERVAYRVAHATLCIACRFDRHKVVKHLLESGLCDARCRFLHPVELRPLHIATACGFGYVAQLLLQHKADPLEGDGSSELPVFKLTRFFTRQVDELQNRVAELEAGMGITQNMHGKAGVGNVLGSQTAAAALQARVAELEATLAAERAANASAHFKSTMSVPPLTPQSQISAAGPLPAPARYAPPPRSPRSPRQSSSTSTPRQQVFQPSNFAGYRGNPSSSGYSCSAYVDELGDGMSYGSAFGENSSQPITYDSTPSPRSQRFDARLHASSM